jgi:cytochrome c-type biogenesis protein CcmF
MGDEAPGGARTVRAYFHPFVTLIWIGALVMFLGGAVSLLDRRYRVGAPRLARARALQPAE